MLLIINWHWQPNYFSLGSAKTKVSYNNQYRSNSNYISKISYIYFEVLRKEESLKTYPAIQMALAKEAKNTMRFLNLRCFSYTVIQFIFSEE